MSSESGSESNIGTLCRTRLLAHRHKARNATREVSEAIERSVGPLSDIDAQRPFMVPSGHDPFDIWHHILDHVTDPHEVLKLWQVCPLFREILSINQKYIESRLPSIFWIIHKRRPWFLLDGKETPGNEGDPVSMWPATSFLSLRRTSRLCQKSVEGVCQGFNINLSRVAVVQKSIDKVQTKEAKPDAFFFRKVKVSEPGTWHNQPQNDSFFEAISKLFELIGKHVLTLEYISARNPQHIYDKLKDMVMHLPNLKSLKLKAEFRGNYESVNVPAFPICPQLKSFIQEGRKLPRGYIQCIIEACPNIHTWENVQDGFDSQLDGLIDPSEMIVKMRHLECLHTRMYSQLIRHLDFRLPLKEILFYHHGTCDELDTSRVFPFLNQFEETLQHLELCVGLKHSGTCELDLPNLKVIRWRYDESCQDLRFLLHAERLEYVEVWLVGDSNPESVSDRFVDRTTGGFDGYTMWQVFPRLKRFTVDFFYGLRCGVVLRRDDSI